MAHTDVTVVPRPRTGRRTGRGLELTECMAALQTQVVGRVALSIDALPAIYPVRYDVDGTDVLFHTQPGSALDRGCRNTVVAFEVDHQDPSGNAGWTVLAVGIANIDHARSREADVVVRIVPGSMNGQAVDAIDLT